MTDRNPPSEPPSGTENPVFGPPADATTGTVVPTPKILEKSAADGAPPDGPGGGNRPPSPGEAAAPSAADRQEAVILAFPMDRVRRPGRSDDTQSAAVEPGGSLAPRSAADWQAAAKIMAEAEAQAVRNAELARTSQVHMKAAADAFQRTQATAAEVRRTIAHHNVDGLRDSAARLRATVAWMDQVLGDLER